MSAFEHLLTLGSFVLAISIATILRFVAAAYHRRRETHASLAHALWVAIIFFGQVSFWLGAYNFESQARMSLFAVAFVVVQPVLLFLQSALVSAGGEKGLDLAAHHAADGRAYMSLHLLSILCETAFMAYAIGRIASLELGDYFPFQALAAAVTLAAIVFIRLRPAQIAAGATLLALQSVNLYFASQSLSGVD
jgi:hypothetical protein